MAHPALELIRSDRLLVAAHRGNSRYAPENTLPAFESALAVGVELVELDYRHARDRVPIVAHDETLDRTTDAAQLWGGKEIRLESKTAAVLRRLDAGSWFAPRFAGTRLPTLDESLDLIQTRATTLIERKSGDAATCVDLLRRKGMEKTAIVQAFDWDFLAECRRLSADLVLGALGQKTLEPAQVAQIVESGFQFVGWNQLDLGRYEIDLLHNAHLRVLAWTVDAPDRALQLADLGIDGLITNDPATIKRQLGAE